MSRKQIYGITLTSEERRMAGYDKTPGTRQTAVSAPVPPPPSNDIAFHACPVILPDGTSGQAHYMRYGSHSHAFQFQAPLNERLYGQGTLNGGTEAIEARAQELVGKAWRQAQAAEQRTMRLPSAPSHLIHTLDKEPQLRPGTAKKFAGLYAVCLRFASGTLTPLSLAFEQPADALNDLRRMQAGDNRTLVVGICCRWGRRWQLARFVADVKEEGEEEQVMDDGSGCEVEHEDDEAEADEEGGEQEE